MSYTFPVLSQFGSKFPGILPKRVQPIYVALCTVPKGCHLNPTYHRRIHLPLSPITATRRYYHSSNSTVNSHHKRPLQSSVSTTSLISACVLLLVTLSFGYAITQQSSTGAEEDQPVYDEEFLI